MLDTNQYNVKPAGNVQNINVKITGITVNIFFCIGSVTGVGDIFWIINIVTPIKIGKTKYGSYVDKSFIQKKKGECLNSVDSINVQYKAINIGI